MDSPATRKNRTEGPPAHFSMTGTMDGSFDWADSECVDQAETIIRHDDNSLGAPDGAHDDLWMARLITAYVAHRLRGSVDLYQEPKPRIDTFKLRSIEERLTEDRSRDWDANGDDNDKIEY